MKNILILLLIILSSCCKLEPFLYIFKIDPKVEFTQQIPENLLYDLKDTVVETPTFTLYEDIYRNGRYYLTKRRDSTLIRVYNQDNIHVIVSNVKLCGEKVISLSDNALIGQQDFKINLPDYTWTDYHCIRYTTIPVVVKPSTEEHYIQIVTNQIDVSDLTISEIPSKKDIVHNKVLDETTEINLPLFPKQEKDNKYVYATRFRCFSEQSSWYSDSEIHITLRVIKNNKQKTITVRRLNRKLITVAIDVSESNDFEIKIIDWDDTQFDIPF